MIWLEGQLDLLLSLMQIKVKVEVGVRMHPSRRRLDLGVLDE